jgi:hypothetical protein
MPLSYPIGSVARIIVGAARHDVDHDFDTVPGGRRPALHVIEG